MDLRPGEWSDAHMRTSNKWMLQGLIMLAFSVGAVGLSGATAETTFSAQELRCEYLSNPLGIDVQKPRLSWLLNSAENVRGQSAYRVLVASSPAILMKEQGDLWDSGRVASEQSTWIEYGGKKLNSGEQAYWKVRVWSDAGRESQWSEQATWSMGLLEASDWHAKWIGEQRPEQLKAHGYRFPGCGRYSR